ncbi:hypothetical protein OJF2_50830 [Aquisphaera giovannonii]|uniref:Uncharacterized protein n=1 Tax=Aquisphaera giovannonii TaxID=406548 RepID=A0A5B9W8M8_9BACT|nr:hypothetical protein [Aquisphaera giovannonii]QEH36499.1 hypothetical protein OJF2_50830 [Aquisphaera giovannonii]
MAVLLTLGGVVFNGFEVPESIAMGGEQVLVVHKLPGGARVIDAMGADHRDIAWSGRFRGGNAEARARLLDGYRIGGQQYLLRWSTYRYQVIVQSFEANFQQPFEIPYSIRCTVVSDESAPVLTGIPAIDELIGSDLAAALGLSDSLGVAQVAGAIATVQQAVNSVNSIKDAPTSSATQISSSIAAAQQLVGATITSTAGAVSAAPSIAAGGNPSSMAGSLAAQANGMGQLAQLYNLSSTLTRMGKNMTQ